MTKTRLNKYLILIIIPFIGLFTSCSSSQSTIQNTNFSSEKYVDNFIGLYPDTAAYKNELKSYKWNYEQGLVFEAIYQVWKQTNNNKYIEYVKKNIDYYVMEDGSIKTYVLDNYNIDNVAPGRVLLHLYEITKLEKYKKAADTLLKQLKTHPRTSEGGFWHKKIYPNQMWLDGLYMAEPFYTEYSKTFGISENYNDIAKQYLLIHKNLYDSKTGLYYHGWDESKKQKWADSVKGTSPNFWGRSLGWFIMSLADVLDTFPKDHADRIKLENIFKNLAAAVLKYQDKDSKLWFQIVDKGEKKGNYIETSSSLMFIYSFAKGFNTGLLDKIYFDAAKEAFNKLEQNKIRISYNKMYLTNVCSVGGLGGNPYRDGSFEYYISEPQRENDFKGYGVLILAANELNKRN